MVEEIVGCKWSLAVLGAIRDGHVRPGAIERGIDGLSTKVMNERLAKLVRFGVLTKTSFPEVPPRVEYALTGFGTRLVAILDEIRALQAEVEAETPAPEGEVSDGSLSPTSSGGV